MLYYEILAITPDIARLAATQHGMVAVRQLYDLGLTFQQVKALREGRQLISVRRGVLRVPGSPASPQRPLLAACLAAGPDARASHWAAADLLKLKGCAGGTVEICVPRSSRRRVAGARVHLLGEPLAKADWTVHDDVPVTTPARTILDLAGTEAKPWLIERMLDDAVVRRLLTLDDLARASDQAGRGHRGRSVILPILEARRTEWGQRFDSVFELRVERVLHAAGIPAPVLHLLVDTTGGMFEIDFAWPRHLAGLDAQGFDPHGTRSAFDHDARRAMWFKRAGWHVQVVTTAMTDEEIVTAAHIVLAATHAKAHPAT